MATKWTYESVKECISNTGCTLLSDTYKNAKTKLKIKCGICGEQFEANLDNFINSKHKSCKSCASSIGNTGRYTIEEIREVVSKTPATLISCDYKGVYECLEFKCECGEIFKTNWTTFISRKKYFCNACSFKKRREKSILDLTGMTFGELRVLHIDKNKKNRIHWMCQCSCGKKASVSSLALTRKDGTKSCGCKAPIKKDFTINDVRQKISELSECELLSTEYINAHRKLLFKCSCGKEFQRSWANFTNKNKRKCPSCTKKESSLEREVREILEQMKEVFLQQYTFDECRNEMVLPFDFYMPEKNIAIEVDGVHHFKPIDYYGGEEQFKKQNIRDEIKNNFCKDNGIKLIRIPYWEVKNASAILKKELQ